MVCEGTLMHHDTPIAHVYIDDRNAVKLDLLSADKTKYPLEMQYISGTAGLLSFFEERVTPKSRQGLWQELRDAGYQRYSIAAVLIESNGRDCSDPFWIRFKEGPQTWQEVWEAVGVNNRNEW